MFFTKKHFGERKNSEVNGYGTCKPGSPKRFAQQSFLGRGGTVERGRDDFSPKSRHDRYATCSDEEPFSRPFEETVQIKEKRLRLHSFCFTGVKTC